MKDLLIILTAVSVVCAWLTHVIHCLITAKYVLLIAGGFFFPIGMLNGFGIWFGMGW